MGVLVAIAWQFFSEQDIFPARLLPVYVFLIGFGSLVLIRTIERWIRRAMFSYGFGINNALSIW